MHEHIRETNLNDIDVTALLEKWRSFERDEKWGYVPETEIVTKDLRDRLREVEKIDFEIERMPSNEFKRIFSLPDDAVIDDENGFIRLPVKRHFQSERLPSEQYGYKGGAARALLELNLELPHATTVRDVDLISFRGVRDEQVDSELERKYMSDDKETGYGIEFVNDFSVYMKSRDLTVNEVFATDSTVWATRQCIADTVRRILRRTEYEVNEYPYIGAKMVAKIVRLLSQELEENRTFLAPEIEDRDWEIGGTSLFWIAVHLDRAYQVGTEVAERFVGMLVQKNQLPDEVTSAMEAVKYLKEELDEGRFTFRHAPKKQFDVEKQWLELEERYSEYDIVPKK